jgi:uncharacterized membrane protein
MANMRWITLIVLCLGVAGYAAVVYAFLPLGAVVHPAMRASFDSHPPAVYGHVFAALLALALGPFQFAPRLRALHIGVHRWLGRLYLGVGVLLGGLCGLYLSAHAYGGPVARAGFACLALGWLYTGLRAYVAIRAGDVVTHRRWMVRNFALTFAAVTLRLYLPASMAVGLAFERAYPVIAWLCWVPNLIVAELLWNRARPMSPAAARAAR